MFKNKSKSFMIMVVFLIIASFSVGDLLSQRVNTSGFSNNNVGWVGDTPISNVEFLKYKEYLSTKNKDITNNEVMRKLGERKAVLFYAENQLNIKINDEKIKEYILLQEQFLTDGIFDKDKYFSYLKEVNMTPSLYESLLRESFVLQDVLVLTDIRNNSERSAEILSESIFQVLEVEMHEMNYLWQDVSFEKEAVLDDYKNNQDDYYSIPEFKVGVEIYSLDDYYKKMYESKKGNIEKVFDMRQILVSEESVKNEIMKDVNEDNFIDLVSEYSIDSSSSREGGLIEGLKESELTPEFKSAFDTNSVGDIFFVRSSIGYHIIKIEKELGSDMTFDDYVKSYKSVLDKSFSSDVENGLLEVSETNQFTLSTNALSLMFDESFVEVGESKFIKQDITIEKITVQSKTKSSNLKIDKKSDWEQIESIYETKLKLRNAIELSKNPEKLKELNNDWILSSKIEINKNALLPQELKDSMYSSKLNEINDLLIGDKYFVFKVVKEFSLETKTDDVKNLINNMYNIESGHILIKEAKKLYPIKISKDLHQDN